MQFLLRAACLKVFMVLMIAFLFIPIIGTISVRAQRRSKIPLDVAVDSSGNIYVIYDMGLVAGNSRRAVAKLSPAGVELMSIGSFGTADGQFNMPNGVTVDSSGNIIVADTHNGRIQVFNSEGVHKLSFDCPGVRQLVSGGAPTWEELPEEYKKKYKEEEYIKYKKWVEQDRLIEFSFPTGVAVDSSDNIIVANSAVNAIQVFNSAGKHLLSFGSLGTDDGQFDSPEGVAVDSHNNIIVADRDNDRIQVFDSAGAHQLSFGSLGSADGQFNSPNGVAVDSSDNIIVADSGNARIQVFNSEGVHKLSFGSRGDADGQFLYPKRVAVDRSDNIIVAERRIQVFNSEGVHKLSIGRPPLSDTDWLIILLSIAIVVPALIHYKVRNYLIGVLLSSIALWGLLFLDIKYEITGGGGDGQAGLAGLALIFAIPPILLASIIIGIPFLMYRYRKAKNK